MHEWINTAIMILVSVGGMFGLGGVQVVIADVKKTVADVLELNKAAHVKLDDAIAKLPKARGVKMAEAAAAASDSIPVSVSEPVVTAPGASW